MDPEEKKQIYKIFIQWYALPIGVRQQDEKTIEQFCKKMDIDLSLIAEFQQESSFSDDLVEQAMRWGKSKLPELIGTLYETASATGNLSHVKTFFDLVNKQDTTELKKLREEIKGSSKKEKTSLRELFKR